MPPLYAAHDAGAGYCSWQQQLTTERREKGQWGKAPAERAVPSFVTQAPRSDPVSSPAAPISAHSSVYGAAYDKYKVDHADSAAQAYQQQYPSSQHYSYDYSQTYARAASPQLSPRSPRQAIAPRAPRRKTVILDMDETLIHSVFEPPVYPARADFQCPMTMDGQDYITYVHKRPGCEEFLRRCVQLFDVIIWTASLECYAKGVIDELERLSGCGRLRRMFRESCTRHNGSYIKELTKIGAAIEDVAIFDNSPHVAVLNPRNLVHVKNFYDDRNDRELYELMPLLDRLWQGDHALEAIAGHKRGY